MGSQVSRNTIDALGGAKEKFGELDAGKLLKHRTFVNLVVLNAYEG